VTFPQILEKQIRIKLTEHRASPRATVRKLFQRHNRKRRSDSSKTTTLHPSKPVRSVEISGASIAMGKSRVLSGEDFRKSKAQRQTVGSSESMNSREAENRGISQRRRRRRGRRRRHIEFAIARIIFIAARRDRPPDRSSAHQIFNRSLQNARPSNESHYAAVDQYLPSTEALAGNSEVNPTLSPLESAAGIRLVKFLSCLHLPPGKTIYLFIMNE